MKLPSTLLILLFSAALVYGQFQQRDRTTRRPQKGGQREERKANTGNGDRQQRSVGSQDNPDCQEGNPLGASYSGTINHTSSGKVCQSWSAQEPHEHGSTEVGEHNYCRNPSGNVLGVYCYTTDPDKRWEHCSVPLCSPTYDCQEGEPLGVTYQ